MKGEVKSSWLLLKKEYYIYIVVDAHIFILFFLQRLMHISIIIKEGELVNVTKCQD